MDFLNQLDTDPKDNNSIFTFNDKNENNKGGASLPFPFSSQSSTGGVGDNNIAFLNDMKSQGGESFNLGQFENDNQNNNNFGGLDFLNTICEVPESSNNIFTQTENNFLSVNLNPNQGGGLDFINEDNENDENNNFDISKLQNNNNNDEPINIDINNLFKSSKTKKNNESKNNSNFQINNLLNIGNNDTEIKINENSDNTINPMKNKISNNNNNIIPNINPNSNTNNSKIKESNIINNDINIIPNKNNNNKSSLPNNNINNSNNLINKQIPNKINQNNMPNKEKASSNNININIKPSSLSGSSSNPMINNINYNIKENKENIPSFPNIQIRSSLNKAQNINLDDIDKIISLNTKNEKKINNPNISNDINNNLPLNQNFFQGKQDNNNNNKIDIAKDNLKYLSNELSNLFNSSLINGKRAEIGPKDKDLQNIDNLLNFTKDNITSISKTKKDQNISKDKNNNKNININKQIQNEEKDNKSINSKKSKLNENANIDNNININNISFKDKEVLSNNESKKDNEKGNDNISRRFSEVSELSILKLDNKIEGMDTARLIDSNLIDKDNEVFKAKNNQDSENNKNSNFFNYRYNNNNNRKAEIPKIKSKNDLSKEEKRELNIKEIFNFYSHQHSNAGHKTTFDSIRDKFEHLNLSEFSKFCTEFKILIPKEKIVEVFKKSAALTKEMSLQEFKMALSKISLAINEDKIKQLKRRIKHFKNTLNYNNKNITIENLKKEQVDELIKKCKEDIKEFNKKTNEELLEEFYLYLEIDDEEKYHQKMKGFVLPIFQGGILQTVGLEPNNTKNVPVKVNIGRQIYIKEMIEKRKEQKKTIEKNVIRVNGLDREYQKKRIDNNNANNNINLNNNIFNNKSSLGYYKKNKLEPIKQNNSNYSETQLSNRSKKKIIKDVLNLKNKNDFELNFDNSFNKNGQLNER